MDPSMVTLNEKNSRRLYNALLNSDTTVLTQMLREGYNMSKIVFGLPTWSAKYTPLEFVVYKNKLLLVHFLLEKGINPNVGATTGNTPLLISIKAGFHQISEKLIIADANTCKLDINGKTPLYWAVDRRNTNIINLLLDHGAEFTIHTALLHAIDLGYLDVVQLLVERGAPLNVVSRETHLTVAIARGHLDIAKYLIKSGADVNLTSKHGTPLNIAIRKGHSDIVKILAESGADVNLTSEYGTPLNIAIRKGHSDIVKILAESSADVNLTSEYGTPLIIAARGEHWDIVKFLMESGAQLNLADKNLPEVRVEKLNFEILNHIVEKGFKVDATLANSSLVWSLELEKLNLVKYFIEQGANVNQKYQNGQSLLSTALKNSDLRSFRLLIESGADPRLAEAEINEKMTKDPDFAIYMKSLDLDSMIQKLTIRKNYTPKGKSTKSVPFFQGRTGLEAPRWQS